MHGDCEHHYLGDPGRLRQVLANLVSNAIKFTEAGEVVLEVSSLGGDEQHQRLCFAVRDSGIGISPDAQGHVFDCFAQADNSTTRRYGGTGLGLAISRRLVGLMGSDIEIDSQPGAGSRFWFTVDLPRVARAADTRPVEPGLRVLLVEDHDPCAASIIEVLQGWAVHVERVRDTRSALARCAAAGGAGDPYDAVLLDQTLSESSGAPLARSLAGGAERIVLLTRVLDVQDGDSRLDANMSAVMKPVRRSALAGALSREEQSGGHIGHTPDQDSRLFDGSRVLVAEDNPVNQELVTIILQSLGCEVVVVGNGQLALDALENAEFDLVLMDCQMPEMDGFAATRALRERERQSGQHMQVVALTANAMSSDRDACLAAGMDDYLSKPFTAGDLQAVLTPILGRDGEPRPANDQPDDAPASLAEARPGAAGEREAAGATAVQERATADPVLDPRVVAGVRDIGRASGTDLFARIADIYMQTSPDIVRDLGEAVDQGIAETVRQRAHALKSSSANVGATGLAELCKTLESMGREGCLDEADTTFAELREAHASVCHELELEKNRSQAA